MALRYGSICSGIEAATVAWHPLGWEAAFFSEIEKFPRAVLAHRWPDVPCHGDFTTIGADEYGAIDLLVGGTPCQSFSVAGLRGGLDDERGNLALEYFRLAQRKRPRWLVWENVPGVLISSEGRDFGAIVGAMAACGYGWAYRCLDAQYFGLAQRRKRVFLVGYLGDWRSAAAVLFERAGLRGDTAPCRKEGQAAPTIPSRSTGGGGCGTDFDCDGGLVHVPPVSPALKARDAKGQSSDGYGDGSPLIAFSSKDFGADAGPVSPPLRAMNADSSHANAGGQVAVAYDHRGREGGAQVEGPHPTANLRAADGGSSRSLISTPAVRRLTPRECERLQGFPDDYTQIPWRGKVAVRCPDGPRFKALGNSMAVPVMAWIGKRIAEVDRAMQRGGR